MSFDSIANLYLGTSSWSAESWARPFYPPGTPPAEFLPIYASHYNTVEIDSAYYRIPPRLPTRSCWAKSLGRCGYSSPTSTRKRCRVATRSWNGSPGFKHVIQTPSEVAFVQKLEEYVSRADNKFQKLDWWMFSKVDESLDNVYLPYYDGASNRVRDFKPDFIFWLNKGNDYFVIFIDPKGTAYTDYERKIDGYQELFKQKGGAPKSIPYGKKSVKVFAFLYTGDTDKLSKAYEKYWFDDIDKALASIIQPA
jgi:hypothetical protein